LEAFRFGLIAEPKGSIGAWESLNGGKFRYGINPGFGDQKAPACESFYALSKRHMILYGRIERLRKELAQAKARELWESA
jgi:hypothetical protein